MRNDPYFVSKKLQLLLIIFPKQEMIKLEADKPIDVSYRSNFERDVAHAARVRQR